MDTLSNAELNMTGSKNRQILLVAACMAAAVAIPGCASFAVDDDVLVKRTAFALGLDAGQFTISNRMDEGTTTRYQVKTTSGKQYSCSVGGSVSVLGKSVSDAICNQVGKDGAETPNKQSSASCNALLKAAGKC